MWACKEETAAPSDNPGQVKLGGTAAQMDFHPFQLYSKKKIGLFTGSAAQLHPAFLLDMCCFGKPMSKVTPQKQRLQKRSCTAKSLFGKWECLTTPDKVKVSLPLLPGPWGAWGGVSPLCPPSCGEQGEGSRLHRFCAVGSCCPPARPCRKLSYLPAVWLVCGGEPRRGHGDCWPILQEPSFAS